MELVYLKSPTGQQHERAQAVLARVREEMPDLEYREVDPRKDPEYASQFPITYAPGLIIDGVIEYVGIPRERMLLDRLRQLESMAKGKSTRAAAKAESEASS
ncbi:MAG: hypothetical protein V3R48_07410 [Thermoplasmata archaeon]